MCCIVVMAAAPMVEALLCRPRRLANKAHDIDNKLLVCFFGDSSVQRRVFGCLLHVRLGAGEGLFLVAWISRSVKGGFEPVETSEFLDPVSP
jgi:hypothetical protein